MPFSRRPPGLPSSLLLAPRPSPRSSMLFPTHNSAPLQIHHDARHPKLPWEPEKCTDLHAMVGGVTTQGVAVRGSIKKK